MENVIQQEAVMGENRLIQGDCLEVMDEMIEEGIKVDVIITDPPYKVITGGKNGTKGKPSGILTKNKQLMSVIPKFNDWLPKVFKLLNNDSHAYFMINMLNLKDLMIAVEDAGFHIHNVLVWKKNNATPNKWYMKNCEYIVFCRKGKSKFINNCGSKVVECFDNPRNKVHPTEKPVGLMELYVSNSTNEGGVVFDPFMGSGSTGVACKNTNRKFIGVELDKNYFDIAVNRINEL